MKDIAIFLGVMLIVLNVTAIALTQIFSNPTFDQSDITVIDGDTMYVEKIGKVRIVEIDAPELDTSEGREALQKAREYFSESEEYILHDTRKRGYYGRKLVDFETKENGFFSAYMMESGNAVPYKKD